LEGLDKIWCWDSESTGLGVNILNVSKLGGVSSVSISSGLGSDSNNSSMDGAGNAILLLEVDFWKMEGLIWVISVVIPDVLFGRLIDQLSHSESLDGFILWNLSSAVKAVDAIRMSLILLTSSVVSSL